MERWFFRFLRATFRALTACSPELASRWAEFLFRTPLRYRKTGRELAWLGRGRFERVAFRRGWLATWSWGDGPPILLVHGWGGHAGRLVCFVPALVERGFSVIAFDAPGHGLSQGWQSSLPEFAAAVQALAKAKGPLYGIVAHSLGAVAVALAMADGLPIDRLVFLSPASEPEHYSGRFARTLSISAPVRESMKRRIERRYQQPWSAYRLAERAAGMRADLLVFHDRRDSKIPFRDGVAVAKAWPGARLIETQGLGHHKILRDRTVIFRAVQFLARPRLAPMSVSAAKRPTSELAPGSWAPVDAPAAGPPRPASGEAAP